MRSYEILEKLHRNPRTPRIEAIPTTRNNRAASTKAYYYTRGSDSLFQVRSQDLLCTLTGKNSPRLTLFFSTFLLLRLILCPT